MTRLVFFVVGSTMLLAAGCAQQPPINFDDSHQRFLEMTMDNLILPTEVTSLIESGSSVCLVSLETERTGDTPLVALVEDSLIEELLAGGFVVVERDEEMLGRLMAESVDTTYVHTLLPSDVTVADLGYSAGASSFGYASATYRGSVTTVKGAGRDSVLTVPTRLASADYIIAYRILECGIVQRSSTKQGYKMREAQIRLHVRLHDAANGRILAARTVESRNADDVRRTNMRWLANYHYTYFPADYPMQNGPAGYREIGGSPRGSDQDGNPR